MTIRSNDVSQSKSLNTIICSDCSLKLENMKQELLVIVNNNVTVNVYPDLVHTARHAIEVGSLV